LTNGINPELLKSFYFKISYFISNL